MTYPESPSAPLTVRITDANVTLGGRPALRGVSWILSPGCHWAVLGPNGAGKSTLLKLMRGDLWPDQDGEGGERTFLVDGREVDAPTTLRRRIGLVSSDQQAHYAQQEWDLDARTAILTGFFDSPFLYQDPTPEQRERAEAVIAELGIEHLAERRLPTLSQGQMRAVLIARALVAEPDILILDEACAGLDKSARRTVLDLVDRVIEQGHTRVCFASHRADELPANLTHALFLAPLPCPDGGGPDADTAPSIIALGRISDVLAEGEKALEERLRQAAERNGSICDGQQAKPVLPTRNGNGFPPDEPLIRIDHATVYIDRKPVLHDICWRMMPGEHWALIGANGAGKTSLCRLILGELFPAFGGSVTRLGYVSQGFDPDDPYDGPGQAIRASLSLADVRGRIGHVSSDLQSRYVYDLPAEDLVCTGFGSTVGLHFNEPTAGQRREAGQWLTFCGLADMATVPMRSLSYGQLRRLMLARALAGGPELIVLDEPLTGLDAPSRAAFREVIERTAALGAHLIFVTHQPGDLPDCITHSLTMENGRIAHAGPREGVQISS